MPLTKWTALYVYIQTTLQPVLPRGGCWSSFSYATTSIASCARVDKTSAFTSLCPCAVDTLQQLLRHHRTMQGGIAGQDSHQAGEVGQHNPAVLGAAARPASAECGAGRPHWPCKSSPHGDPHAGKFAASSWFAGLLAKAPVLC